jgi:hypothetical protein
MASRDSSWKSVELPEEIVSEAEELMREKHEGRLTKVPLGLFIADLIHESLERKETSRKYETILEDYSIDNDCVYIRDYKRDVIAELTFKDGPDLYCNIDGAKNCVHVGFAWSIPKVRMLMAAHESRPKMK